jgi:(p)ppGpp synthase/HD superfamily hydrolase
VEDRYAVVKRRRLLGQRFEEALVLAYRLHADQSRKGADTPYIAHCLAVASLVIENGGNEDEAIAALLHDVIEDQGGQKAREEIRRRFGRQVVEIIDGCTDTDQVPKPPWRKRKEDHIARLRKHSSASVRLVFLADKVHNAKTILADYLVVGETLWERFKGGKAGTLWYYRTLVEVFKTFGSSPLFRELDRLVSEIGRLSDG